MTPRTQTIRVRDKTYTLTSDDVIAAARREQPRRVNAYYVEIEGRRFPPKQLLRVATGTTEAFDSAVAVRALKSLGFEVVRTSES